MLDLQFYNLNNSTPEWEELYRIAQNDKEHLLWENYQNIDLNTYESMILTTCGDLPASFQGIYNNGRWPSNVSRICNRAYINPYFRNKGLGLEITWRNIEYTLDNYNRWGKDVLFISRGVQYNNAEVSWRKFEKFCKFLIEKTGYTLTYDSNLYQCCPSECKDCYQFCVWYDPKNLKNSLNIQQMPIEQWQQLQ